MTAPTDSRAEARALIVEARNIDAGYFTASADGRTTSIRTRLLAALEAALEREERVATAARNYIRAYNADTENFPHGYSEADALDALVKALEG